MTRPQTGSGAFGGWRYRRPRRRPRVLLIRPRAYADVETPPLGLGYLAAQLRGVADVRIVDAVRARLTTEGLLRLLRRFEPDVVGLTVVTYAAPTSLEYARLVKEQRPGCLVVAGGPHPSLMPEHYLRSSRGYVDFAAIGDAELSFADLVRATEGAGDASRSELAAGVANLAWLDRHGALQQSPRETPDIDACGMPDWSAMPPSTYPRAPHGAFYRQFPVAPLITTRGCPYACSFCSVPTLSGRRMRYRDLDLVAGEMRWLRLAYGVREVQFVDDNLTISRRHALDLCQKIIASDLVMPWSCPNGVRVDALDDELLDAMQAAGCYSISLGIESGSRRILGSMVKHLDLDVVAERVEAIARRGMEANAFFILGYPGETVAEAEETLRLSKALPLTRANFSIFSPLPGTPEFTNLARSDQERIVAEARSYAQVSVANGEETLDTLKQLQRRGILEFYLRPRQARALVGQMRSVETAWYVARRARHWFAS